MLGSKGESSNSSSHRPSVFEAEMGCSGRQFRLYGMAESVQGFGGTERPPGLITACAGQGWRHQVPTWQTAEGTNPPSASGCEDGEVSQHPAVLLGTHPSSGELCPKGRWQKREDLLKVMVLLNILSPHWWLCNVFLGTGDSPHPVFYRVH